MYGFLPLFDFLRRSEHAERGEDENSQRAQKFNT